jgi:hypothetical protein
MIIRSVVCVRAEQEQLMTNRGQYLTQQNENEMVKQVGQPHQAILSSERFNTNIVMLDHRFGVGACIACR